ncbi:MAG: hypothetical protein ABL958_08305 [Bdellovibrionia bacterium]
MKFCCALVAVCLLASCGFQEDQKSLYNQQKLGFDPITITIPTKIDATQVKPSGLAMWCSRILDWIPGVCGLVNLPVNVLMAVIAPVPFKDNTPLDLPENVPWTDPKVLPYIKSVRVMEGRIRIVPEAERIDYKEPRCWMKILRVKKLCPVEHLKFLSELQINLVFSPKILGDCRKTALTETTTCETRKKNKKDCQKSAERKLLLCKQKAQILIDAKKELPEIVVPLAKASAGDLIVDEKHGTDILPFKMSRTDLRPYLNSYKDFSVDVEAKGKYPKRVTWIDGDLKLEFVIQLPEPY